MQCLKCKDGLLHPSSASEKPSASAQLDFNPFPTSVKSNLSSGFFNLFSMLIPLYKLWKWYTLKGSWFHIKIPTFYISCCFFSFMVFLGHVSQSQLLGSLSPSIKMEFVGNKSQEKMLFISYMATKNSLATLIISNLNATSKRCYKHKPWPQTLCKPFGGFIMSDKLKLSTLLYFIIIFLNKLQDCI